MIYMNLLALDLPQIDEARHGGITLFPGQEPLHCQIRDVRADEALPSQPRHRFERSTITDGLASTALTLRGNQHQLINMPLPFSNEKRTAVRGLGEIALGVNDLVESRNSTRSSSVCR